MHRASREGLVRACHDLSEGGLAAAAAEMAFAGGLGGRLELDAVPADLPTSGEPTADAVVPRLFSESNSRFLCEVPPDQAGAFEAALSGVPHARIGEVNDTGRLEIVFKTTSGDVTRVVDAAAIDLKQAWQAPLNWK
jgi:phosphoribosylformylglycinamidine synthase